VRLSPSSRPSARTPSTTKAYLAKGKPSMPLLAIGGEAGLEEEECRSEAFSNKASDNPLGKPCAKGDNHSSVALQDHELISFQCHLDTLRYVEDTVFQSCRSSR
jgi:hypothetical protein